MVNPAYLLVDHLFVVNFSFGFFVFISYLHFLHSWKPHKQAGKGEESVCLCGCRCRGGGERGPSGMQVFPLALFIFAFCIYNVCCCCCCLLWLLLTCQHTQTQTNLWQRVSLFSWLAFFITLTAGGWGEWLHLWFVLTAALNINKYFNNLFIYLLNHPLRDDMRLTFYILRNNAFLRGYVFDLCNNCFEKHIKTNQLNFCFLLNFLSNIYLFYFMSFFLGCFYCCWFLSILFFKLHTQKLETFMHLIRIRP